MTFRIAYSVVLSSGLFLLGFVVHGSWHDAVLEHYAMNCTLLPDPAPYPFHLIRLAEGKLSVKGVRELLACDWDPLPGFERVAK